MMRRGQRSALVFDRPGHRMIATENGWIFEFDAPPLMLDVSYALGDGSMLHLDDRITRLAGARTSAGYRDLNLWEGNLRYAGAIGDGNGVTLLFSWSELPDHLVFYGFNVVATAPLLLAFATPARSSRLIETTIVERAA
jgi:hypothetical protein